MILYLCFNINGNFFEEKALGKPIHGIVFIKYSPKSLATINNNISIISIKLPIEDA